MHHYLLSQTKKRQYALLAGDILTIILAFYLAYLVRVYMTAWAPTPALALSKITNWPLIPIVGVHVFVLFLLDQYTLNKLMAPTRALSTIILASVVSGGIISGIFFYYPEYVFGRQVLFTHVAFASILLPLWRQLCFRILLGRMVPKKLAVVGGGDIVSAFTEALAQEEGSGFTVKCVCLLDDKKQLSCPLSEDSMQFDSVMDMLESDQFNALAFDPQHLKFNDEEIRKLLLAKYAGKPLYDLPSLYMSITGRVPIFLIDGGWLLLNDAFKVEVNKPYLKLKRAVDILGVLILATLFAPVIAVLPIFIKLFGGKGPVLYKQERLGHYRKPFNCYKFRTMCDNAEQENGPTWSTEGDSRITKLGMFMRKTRLDELPQLYNILCGDMSFIGPRPIREHFANSFSKTIPFYDVRHYVSPGLTGWAQVHGCYAVPYGLEALQYELFYIKNMSLLLDLQIIFFTVKTVFNAKGK